MVEHYRNLMLFAQLDFLYLFLLLIFFLFFKLIYLLVCEWGGLMFENQDNPQELVFSFLYVGSGDQTWVLSLAASV